MVVFLLAVVMWATAYPVRIKEILISLSFGAVMLDVGGWWLAKLSPGLAILVILGGASLGLTWGLMIILPLFEIWLKKSAPAKS